MEGSKYFCFCAPPPKSAPDFSTFHFCFFRNCFPIKKFFLLDFTSLIPLALNFILRLKNQRQSPEVFCEKGVLKNFAIFTGKHLCCSFFLIKLQGWWPATLLKRDSNNGVFLWILLSFQELRIKIRLKIYTRLRSDSEAANGGLL